MIKKMTISGWNVFSNVFIYNYYIYTNLPTYQYITKIRGWDVFSIVFKKMENFSLNVFINIVFIKKMCIPFRLERGFWSELGIRSMTKLLVSMEFRRKKSEDSLFTSPSSVLTDSLMTTSSVIPYFDTISHDNVIGISLFW